VTRPGIASNAEGLRPIARRRELAVAAASVSIPLLLAVVAYRCVSTFEFSADARNLVLNNRFLHDPAGALGQVTHDYFWSSSGTMIPYWRPFTKLSWWVEWQLFGNRPAAFEWVSVAWHLMGIGGLYLLARDLGSGRGASSIAATVYALHPVAIEPVALLMARSDVVSGAAVLWSVVAWLRAQRPGAPARAWWALHVVATVVALASKEVAVIVPAILVVWALIDPKATDSPRRRAWSLAPAIALTLAYLVLRRTVLAAEDPAMLAFHGDCRPGRILASLGLYFCNLWPLTLHSTVRDVAAAEAQSGWFVLRAALAWAVVTSVVVIATRRRDRNTLALCAWALLALSPVILTREIFVPTSLDKFALADRWLYHALGPALLACVRTLEPVARGRNAAATIAATISVWAVLMLVRSTRDRMPLASELAMLDNDDDVFYGAIPVEFRTPSDECRMQQRRLARAQLRSDLDAVADGAAGVLRVCGRSQECAIPWLALTEMARQRSDLVEAASRAQRAYACGGRRDPSLLLAASAWLLSTGDRASARSLLNRAEEHALSPDQAAEATMLHRQLDTEH